MGSDLGGHRRGSSLFLQLALVAFAVGGVTAGATAVWQGADDGVPLGVVMWFAALVSIIVFSAIGSGRALGSFDTVDQANGDAQDAAGKALTLGLAAAGVGGALGAKIWPKDDSFIVVVRRRNMQ